MEQFSPAMVWFLFGLVCLFLEFIIPGVVIGFFGAGAWITALLTLFLPLPLEQQLLIFIAASLVLLFGLRRNLQRWFFKTVPDALDDQNQFIGERAVVVEAISARFPGKVELHGTRWEAEAEEEIEVGTPVVIRSKRNLTLIVEPL
ncbi:NfeD family protein [candidate division KSB1 bacterium]|nr:NfeD family protein [candidate division KSB1 bacterium]